MAFEATLRVVWVAWMIQRSLDAPNTKFDSHMGTIFAWLSTLVRTHLKQCITYCKRQYDRVAVTCLIARYRTPTALDFDFGCDFHKNNPQAGIWLSAALNNIHSRSPRTILMEYCHKRRKPKYHSKPYTILILALHSLYN